NGHAYLTRYAWQGEERAGLARQGDDGVQHNAGKEDADHQQHDAARGLDIVLAQGGALFGGKRGAGVGVRFGMRHGSIPSYSIVRSGGIRVIFGIRGGWGAGQGSRCSPGGSKTAPPHGPGKIASMFPPPTRRLSMRFRTLALVAGILILGGVAL